MSFSMWRLKQLRSTTEATTITMKMKMITMISSISVVMMHYFQAGSNGDADYEAEAADGVVNTGDEDAEK